MIKNLALSIGLFVAGGTGYASTMGFPGNEQILCEVKSFESQGFAQLSKHEEYVCENILDDTDFIVVEDEFSEFRLGDVLNAELNLHGELVDYEVINIAEL